MCPLKKAKSLQQKKMNFASSKTIENIDDVEKQVMVLKGTEPFAPKLEWNWLSFATVSWLDPLLRIGYRRPLQIEDSFQFDTHLCASYLHSNFSSLSIQSTSLLHILFRIVWKETILMSLIKLISVIIQIWIHPSLLAQVLQYVVDVNLRLYFIFKGKIQRSYLNYFP